jgi:hypothetical protein
MDSNRSDYHDGAKTDENAAVKPDGGKSASMAPEDRRQFVLEVLEGSGAAMKAVDVFRNCKLQGGTFERRSTVTYLNQLVESGDVLKVKSDALNDGDIIEVDEDDKRGHFIAASVAAELRD